MTDDKLPIVFKSSALMGLVMVAVGAGIAAVGIVRITDDSFSFSMERIGPFELDPQTVGWLMVAIGVPVALIALVTVVRRCPTLTLDETGLSTIPLLRNPDPDSVEQAGRSEDQTHGRTGSRPDHAGRCALSGDG